MDISIIIVSYNTRDLLRECLASVLASAAELGPNSYEVLAVDNASADGSAQMVQQEFPQVKLIVNQENRGFAAANNQALKESGGRYLLLLNPDTRVLNHALAILMAFLDACPEVGTVSPKLLNPDGSLQHGAFHFPTLWMSFFDFFPINHRLINSRLNGRYPLSAYGAPFQIDHPLGACFMVRRETMEQVGLLDEGYFMYCEEVDWCLRMKRAGWQVWCQPEAQVVHYVGASTRQFREAMFVELHKSRLRLFRKHYPAWWRWGHRQITRLGLAREWWRTWWQKSRGQLSASEATNRHRAYTQVLELLKNDA